MSLTGVLDSEGVTFTIGRDTTSQERAELGRELRLVAETDILWLQPHRRFHLTNIRKYERLPILGTALDQARQSDFFYLL